MKQNYDRDLVQKAIMKWRGFDKRSSLTNKDFFAFAIFIGHPHNAYVESSKIVDTDKQEVRHIIDLINSPHGNTILKMLEIRNADNEVNNDAPSDKFLGGQ